MSLMALNTAMSVMLAMMKHDDHRKRAVAATHLASFFAASGVDYSRYNQDLVRVLLISFGDRDKDVVSGAWSALSQLQSHLRKEEMEALVPSTRQVLQQAGTAGSIPAWLRIDQRHSTSTANLPARIDERYCRPAGASGIRHRRHHRSIWI